MQTIKQYLDNLFLGLPETPQVLRAKAELLEMMEDKYEQLMADGKSEQEAVGIVISEFGSLEELAEELGIEGQLGLKGSPAEEQEQTASGSDQALRKSGEEEHQEREHLFMSREKLEEYTAYIWKHARLIGFGVALFIACAFAETIIECFPFFVPLFGVQFAAILLGTGLCGAMICAGVILCVRAKSLKKEQVDVKQNSLIIDGIGTEYLQTKRAKDEETCSRLCLIGIICIVFGTLPSSFAEFVQLDFVHEILDSSILLFVAIGVMLLIIANSVKNRYRELNESTFYVENGEYKKVFEGYVPKKMSSTAKVILVLSIVGIVILHVSFDFLYGIIRYRGGEDFSIQEAISSGNENETMDGSVSMQELKQVEISLDAADVVIKTGEVENVEYTFSGVGRLEADFDEGTGILSFTNEDSYGVLHILPFGKEMGKLTITLPKDSYQTAIFYDISVDAGDVSMEQIAAGKAVIEVDAGDVKMRDSTFERVEAEVDAGDVSMDNTEITNQLQCDVDAGNVTIRTAQTENDYLAGHHLNLENDMGEIKIFGTDYHEGYHSAPSDRTGQASKVNIEVDMGNITIQN